MVFSAQNESSFGDVYRVTCFSFALVVSGVFFQNNSVYADQRIIPPGFRSLPSGEFIVADPITAFAPDGYRISVEGFLLKDEKTTGPDIIASAEAETEGKTEAEVEAIPRGYHRMGNGDIMANSPSKAVAPPGYRLIEGGILRKLNADAAVTTSNESKVTTTAETELIAPPPGFHRMPNGTFMANSPSKAVAPEGYHLMEDGTLMANGSSTDHSVHSHEGHGMWMAEYKYMRMYMDGLLDTTMDVTPEEVVDATGKYRYSMSPTDMSMDMHMFMLMYHSTEYMVMVMAHYMANDMGMLSVDGSRSTMKTSGLGDTIVTAEIPWRYGMDYTLGVSLPTGSIDERGPMRHLASLPPEDVKYPYGMQLGSGTFDLIVGVGYEKMEGDLHWGADYKYTLRTGTNDNNYTLGDKMVLDGWLRRHFTNELNSEVRLKFIEIDQISGFDDDPDLDPNMSPAADASNYGGRRLDVELAVRYETAMMTSVGFELALPVYQNLFGPQMKTEWIAGINVGFMF